jgi:hypothetical protein
MKTLLLAFSFLLTTIPAHARVDAKFLTFVGMIAVSDRVMGQVTDDDPQRLMALMNVPLESDGKTKVIKFADNKFSLVCGDRGGGALVCSVTVKQGPQGIVSPSKGVIRFVALGQEAADLHQKLFANPETGRVEYFSVDGSLRLVSDGQSFLVEFLKR